MMINRASDSQPESAKSAEQLLPLVYEELRRIAAQKIAQEKPGQTLQPTALVHEAYLRLLGNERKECWESRNHFFAAAAEAMRRILIDAARRKKSVRHGGMHHRLDLLDGDAIELANPDELLDLDAALSRLAAVDPASADIVKLRVFAGMTIEEVAELQGISSRTAKRNWAYARAWLGRELTAYGKSDA